MVSAFATIMPTPSHDIAVNIIANANTNANTRFVTLRFFFIPIPPVIYNLPFEQSFAQLLNLLYILNLIFSIDSISNVFNFFLAINYKEAANTTLSMGSFFCATFAHINSALLSLQDKFKYSCALLSISYPFKYLILTL